MKFDKTNSTYQALQLLERKFRGKIVRPIKQFLFIDKAEKGLRNIFILPIEKIIFKNKLRTATPIIIYQMGKVASTSIHRSLLSQYPGAVAFSHSLDEPHWRAELVYDWFKKGNTVKIITLTREPIARNISGFYQWFENYVGVPFWKSTHSIKELQSIFYEKYDHTWALEWFDKNIKRYFDIDLYEKPFPRIGYGIYKNNNAEVLVIKAEADNAIKEQAIREYLELPNFVLQVVNVGSEKFYAKSYKQFKSSFDLTESYRKMIEESKYYIHFYGDDAFR